jgi:hypothetical protein
MDGQRERKIPRRQFVRSAVAIGGASALAACTEREQSLLDDTATDEPKSTPDSRLPAGNPDERPVGQHEWNEFLVHDSAGNTVPPEHQLVLGLSYDGATPPTDAERETAEAAFHTLDRALQWGTGGDAATTFTRGLLFLIGYAPSYFDSVGGVPDELIRPEALLEAVGEDPTKTDGFDAVIVLTSDVGSVVLAAEQALFGERDQLNGRPVEGTLSEAFSVVERRTGFAGQGLPANKLDHEEIPERAPLSMGFKSGFTDSLPAEDRVTLTEGPFAGGTTFALSRLRLDLDRWYENSHEDRVDAMFCPAHDPEEVGPVGTNLGDDSGIERADVENIPDHAAEFDRLGHSQKVARARDDDFRPRILRRSEGFATDASKHTGFNFSSVQRSLDAFIEARRAMNVNKYDVDVASENHGIVDYVTTVDRGTYLVPRHSNRALPVPEN